MHASFDGPTDILSVYYLRTLVWAIIIAAYTILILFHEEGKTRCRILEMAAIKCSYKIFRYAYVQLNKHYQEIATFGEQLRGKKIQTRG